MSANYMDACLLILKKELGLLVFIHSQNFTLNDIEVCKNFFQKQVLWNSIGNARKSAISLLKSYVCVVLLKADTTPLTHSGKGIVTENEEK